MAHAKCAELYEAKIAAGRLCDFCDFCVKKNRFT